MWHGKVFARTLYPDRTLHLTQTRRTQCTQRHSQLGHLVGERYYISPSAAKYPTGLFYSDAHVALLHPLALLHSPDTPTPRSDVREKPCTEKILFGQFFDGVEYPPADMKP